jgi:hypothetical protein
LKTAQPPFSPFLTMLDPRAKIRGSRDPLGLQPLWSRLGRNVVHNLTTVTTSVRGFTTLILGFYFAERLVEEGGAPIEQITPAFLKFEQLAAYSRVAWRDRPGNEELDEDELRGVVRARVNLREGAGRVTISASQDWQILANQRSYGLWGLYTVSARASGLLVDDPLRLSVGAREFVESEYVPRIGRNAPAVLQFLRNERSFQPQGKDAALAEALANIHGPGLSSREHEFYRHHLLYADGDAGQKALWEQLLSLSGKKQFTLSDAFDMRELRELEKRCANSERQMIADHLERIRIMENFAAPLGRFIDFMLCRDGQNLASIGRTVETAWVGGLGHLDSARFATVLGSIPDLPGSHTSLIERLAAAGRSLHAGRMTDTARELLAANAAVMRERGAAPWATLETGKLEVRFRESDVVLPEASELPDLWDNTYFLNAFKAIGYQLHRGQ